MTKQQKNNGFTLVELSIVLVIIGLLIGGILVGQSLIDSAKITKLTREIQNYEIAVNLFGTRFKKLPGDLPNATTLLGVAVSGNGDGLINGGYTGLGGEYMYVFEELVKAGFLQGPAYGGTAFGHGDTAYISPGINTYKFQSYKDLGLLFTQQGGMNTNNSGYSNYFLLGGRSINDLANPTSSNFTDYLLGNVLTSLEAMALDNKIDDGIAQSGVMKSGGYVYSKVNQNLVCYSGGKYLTTSASGCISTIGFTPKF